MKRWLIPVTVVALMIAGATAGAFASGEKDRGSAFENSPPVSSDGASTQAGCELGASECDDTPDTCEPVPLRSDCGIDPDVCNQVHNIDACDGPVFSDTGDPEPHTCAEIHDVISCGPQQKFDGGDEDMPPVSSDIRTEPLECSLANDVDGCQDAVDSACEPVPLRSDCGIDPNECNKVHNITACSGPGEDGVGPIVVPDGGTVHYEVVVRFNPSVEQGDFSTTSDFLRAYGTGLDFIVQESWPPTGVANLQMDTSNFCDAIFDELASQSYIDDFSCGPQQKFDGGIEDMPVVNVNDLP